MKLYSFRNVLMEKGGIYMILIVEEIDTTNQAIEVVKNLGNVVGEIKSVEHRHTLKTPNYETKLIGTDGEILIKGGFSSGYPGEGPRGLKKVLINLGFPPAQVEEKVYGSEKRFVLTK